MKGTYFQFVGIVHLEECIWMYFLQVGAIGQYQHCSKVGELLTWIRRPKEPWVTGNLISVSVSHLPSVGTRPMQHENLSKVKLNLLLKGGMKRSW